MLKYIAPPNWFFVIMAVAIVCYMAYNLSTNKAPGKTISAAPLIRYIVR